MYLSNTWFKIYMTTELFLSVYVADLLCRSAVLKSNITRPYQSRPEQITTSIWNLHMSFYNVLTTNKHDSFLNFTCYKIQRSKKPRGHFECVQWLCQGDCIRKVLPQFQSGVLPGFLKGSFLSEGFFMNILYTISFHCTHSQILTDHVCEAL